MAAAPLKSIIAAEAAGAMLVGAALLVFTGGAVAALELPDVWPALAVVRLVAVLVIGFGALLWGVRHLAAQSREAVAGLAIGHGIAAVVLALQHVAIWDTRVGFLLAVVPLALAVRYTQYAMRLARDGGSSSVPQGA